MRRWLYFKSVLATRCIPISRFDPSFAIVVYLDQTSVIAVAGMLDICRIASFSIFIEKQLFEQFMPLFYVHYKLSFVLLP
ncbi:unnamed protein product [Rhodiola kirilowii]